MRETKMKQRCWSYDLSCFDLIRPQTVGQDEVRTMNMNSYLWLQDHLLTVACLRYNSGLFQTISNNSGLFVSGLIRFDVFCP